ncbi:MAG: hypothetical protein AAF738_08465 [Bacteroidota bacterium]
MRLLPLVALSLMFFTSCTKEEIKLDEELATELEGNTELSDEITLEQEEYPDEMIQTVYFEGIGDITATLKKQPDGTYKVAEDTDLTALESFLEEVKEPHLYFDANNKMHVFKSEGNREGFVKTFNNVEERCTENYGGYVEARFFKHSSYRSEYDHLRKRMYSSGYFQIPYVGRSANDEISSVSVSNTRRKADYAVVLYQHSRFRGSSVWVTVPKCSSWKGIRSLKENWLAFSPFFDGWQIITGNFNDRTSSIVGFYMQ